MITHLNYTFSNSWTNYLTHCKDIFNCNFEEISQDYELVFQSGVMEFISQNITNEKEELIE